MNHVGWKFRSWLTNSGRLLSDHDLKHLGFVFQGGGISDGDTREMKQRGERERDGESGRLNLKILTRVIF